MLTREQALAFDPDALRKKNPPCEPGKHDASGFKCLVDHDGPQCDLCTRCGRHVQFFDDGRQVLRDRS